MVNSFWIHLTLPLTLRAIFAFFSTQAISFKLHLWYDDTSLEYQGHVSKVKVTAAQKL